MFSKREKVNISILIGLPKVAGGQARAVSPLGYLFFVRLQRVEAVFGEKRGFAARAGPFKMVPNLTLLKKGFLHLLIYQWIKNGEGGVFTGGLRAEKGTLEHSRLSRPQWVENGLSHFKINGFRIAFMAYICPHPFPFNTGSPFSKIYGFPPIV